MPGSPKALTAGGEGVPCQVALGLWVNTKKPTVGIRVEAYDTLWVK